MAQQPDAFQSKGQQIVKVLSDNKKTLSAGLIALVMAGAGYFSYERWENHKEELALEALSAVEIELDNKRQELSKDDKKLDPTQFDENFKDLSDRLETVILSHKGRTAAVVSAIRLVGFYLSLDQFDRAEKMLAEFPEQGQGRLLQSLLIFQRSTVAMAKEQYDQATMGFEQLLDQKESEFLHPETLLRLGLCYEKMDQVDRARDAYLRATTEFAESNAGRQAKTYLRLLELEKRG